MPVPKSPKIYHITHAKNLSGIVDEVLWSDVERIKKELECTIVGMSEIKRRRLEELEVSCHPGTHVGDYVPFYFCPRSIMLYLLHRGNAPGLTYQGGQGSIVHLQADFNTVLQWARTRRMRWAFTNGNAGAYYAQFFDDPARLDRLNWEAIAANDWRDPDTKRQTSRISSRRALSLGASGVDRGDKRSSCRASRGQNQRRRAPA